MAENAKTLTVIYIVTKRETKSSRPALLLSAVSRRIDQLKSALFFNKFEAVTFEQYLYCSNLTLFLV